MSTISHSKLEDLLIDPGASYLSPQDVIDDPRLQPEQRIAILCSWAYDTTELAVADEDGMSGGSPTISKEFSMRSTRCCRNTAPGKDPQRSTPDSAAILTPPAIRAQFTPDQQG